MALSDDLAILKGKLDEAVALAVAEKDEVVAAINKQNLALGEQTAKLDAANVKIEELIAKVAELQAQLDAGTTVDLSPLAAEIDSLKAQISDIYVEPVVVPE